MGTNDGDKLDAAMDGFFRRSRLASSSGTPAPGSPDGERSGVAWDDRADAILAAAYAAPASKSGPDAVTEALLAAPDLEHEPGEPAAHAAAAPQSRNGTQQMSDDMSSKPPPSRRPSLKELAESMKNRPSTPAPSSVRSSDLPPSSAAPGSAPGSQRHSLKDTLVALDGQLPAPPSARPHTPAPVGQRGSSPSIPGSSPGPISAGPGSAPPSSTGPSSTGPASAPASAPAVALAPSPPASSPIAIPSTKPSPGVGKAKQGGGAGVGIVIAVIGLAAAAGFGLYMKSKSATPAPTVAAVETAAPAAEPVNDAPKEAAKPEEKKADDGVLDLSQLDDATAANSAAPALGGPLPKSSASAAAAPSAVAAAEPPKPGGPNEELGDAIKKRAGGGAGVGEDAEPAAAEGSKKNLPDVPPTGAVTSAVNAVKGGAKGCVAGAEEPSTATITFGSSGAVQSVTVGGWAAGKSAAGCIKSALQAAKVPAFARPSYSTSVTIRP